MKLPLVWTDAAGTDQGCDPPSPQQAQKREGTPQCYSDASKPEPNDSEFLVHENSIIVTGDTGGGREGRV